MISKSFIAYACLLGLTTSINAQSVASGVKGGHAKAHKHGHGHHHTSHHTHHHARDAVSDTIEGRNFEHPYSHVGVEGFPIHSGPAYALEGRDLEALADRSHGRHRKHKSHSHPHSTSSTSHHHAARGHESFAKHEHGKGEEEWHNLLRRLEDHLSHHHKHKSHSTSSTSHSSTSHSHKERGGEGKEDGHHTSSTSHSALGHGDEGKVGKVDGHHTSSTSHSAMGHGGEGKEGKGDGRHTSSTSHSAMEHGGEGKEGKGDGHHTSSTSHSAMGHGGEGKGDGHHTSSTSHSHKERDLQAVVNEVNKLGSGEKWVGSHLFARSPKVHRPHHHKHKSSSHASTSHHKVGRGLESFAEHEHGKGEKFAGEELHNLLRRLKVPFGEGQAFPAYTPGEPHVVGFRRNCRFFWPALICEQDVLMICRSI